MENQQKTGVLAHARNVGAKLAAGSALAAASFAASAQTAGFDSATVTAKITENGATAVLIVGTMILAIWGIKSMGLFKRG